MAFRLQYKNLKLPSKEFSNLEEFLELCLKPDTRIFNTYYEFFSFMNKKCIPFEHHEFFVFPAESGVIVLTNKDSLKLLAVYKFENDTLKNLFYQIFRLKDGGSGRMIISTFSNYFSFVIREEVMNVIFKVEDLKSKGIPLYNEFKKQCKNGKVRDIIAPEAGEVSGDFDHSLRKFLKECNGLFQKIFDGINAEFQVAYKKGKSIKDNAKIHLDNPYTFHLDLKDFFPSCKRALVDEVLDPVFEKIFNGEFLRSKFLDAILVNDALYMGNPVSGCLANRIIADAATYLNNVSNKFNMKFSIYADDITFSSYKFISKKFAESLLEQALIKTDLEHYFVSNNKKSKGESKNRRNVTGASLNEQGKITINRNYYANLRASFDYLRKGKFQYSLQKLSGKLAYAVMLDDTDKIKNLIIKYLPEVKQYNLLSDEKLEKMGVI